MTSLRNIADGLGTMLSSLWNTVKSLPVIGSAVENLPRTLGNLGDTALQQGRALGQRAWQGVHAFAGRLVPQGLRDAIAQRRFNQTQEKALTTASQWSQGTIGSLDDAHTRALVASVVETESHGGDLGVRNLGNKGYVGRYQAGARWLADAGLIQGGAAAVTAAMQHDGVNPQAKGAEWQWAQSGGMDRFLKNSANWANGLSLETYMGSAALQDAAFKTHSQRAYEQLVREQLITPQTPALEVAGLLKARHIAGIGGARQVARGGDSAADIHNTSARRYFDHMTTGTGAEYVRVFAASAAVPEPVRLPTPMPVPTVAAPTLPLASGQPPRVIVANPPPEPGQDVRERSIAHIVTGGLAGG